jgi:hypothetical protein
LLLNFLIEANAAREGRAGQYKKVSGKKGGKGQKAEEEPGEAEREKGSGEKGS